MRDPITIDDHQNSRLIVAPLRLLDCCLISDGAVCVIVTSPERARDCARRPVAIWGMGQGHTTENCGREWWYLSAPARLRGGRLPHGRGVAADIDVAQLYIHRGGAVLARACRLLPRGRSRRLRQGGTRIRWARLPINTAGGNSVRSYMQGWLHIVEGVRQLRGNAASAVQDAELCLVTGRGMTLNTASCLILGH
jgi:acetyl-CoA acetyltransferase